MYLSRQRRALFIHIPKTGGTSLALMLESKALADDEMLGDTPKALRRRSRLNSIKAAGRLWKHSRLCDLYGLISDEDVDNLFIFTIVRNPWDRLVSYHEWLKGQNFPHPHVKLAKELHFSHFIRDPSVVATFRNNPYRSYLRDRSGVDRCSLYIKLEELATGISLLESRLGCNLGQIPHANRSPREKDYRRYYKDDDAEFVGDMCYEDIHQFSYRFSS